MKLREYQQTAVNRTMDMFREHRSLLGVAATGLGKTVIFCHIAKRMLEEHPDKRVMIVAHRRELIAQAAASVKKITGISPDIEQAEQRACSMFPSPIVVASKDTLRAGRAEARVERFDPASFSLVIIDEAHRSVAKTYRYVVDHFSQSKIFGTTATPDRLDKVSLGNIFESHCFNYDLGYGVDRGWLVEPVQYFCRIDSLDFSVIRNRSSDFSDTEIYEAVKADETVMAMAKATVERAEARVTIVFAVNIQHAISLASAMETMTSGGVRVVTGMTPDDERAKIMTGLGTDYQFLVNVGVATEGFDAPLVSHISMCRPTKSRALYTQCIGRGTRPVAGILDSYPLNEYYVERKERIAMSPKQDCLVTDFVGNSSRHKLICTLDILGGNMDARMQKYVRKIMEDSAEGMSVAEAKELAKKKIEENRRNSEWGAVKERREKTKEIFEQVGDLHVAYSMEEVSWRTTDASIVALLRRQNGGNVPFNAATEKQIKYLAYLGYTGSLAGMTKGKAGKIINEIKKRKEVAV